MRKYKKQIKMETEYKLKSIKCDFCGKKGDTIDGLPLDVNSFQIGFGYGSKYDTELHKFDICDDCYEKFIKNKAKFKKEEFDEYSKIK
jgi:hypothetical protein